MGQAGLDQRTTLHPEAAGDGVGDPVEAPWDVAKGKRAPGLAL